MKIDLCRLFGVEEGEEFKLENTNYDDRVIFKIQDDVLFNGFSGEGLTKSLITLNDISKVTVIKLPKKKQFSQDTLNFFKMIDKKYKWIAKDKNGDIFGFEEKPKKDKYVWLCEEYDYCLDNTCCIDGLNQSLFNEILWEDEEPIYIDDYVER